MWYRFTLFPILLLFLIIASVKTAHCHANGSSIIDIYPKENSIDMDVDINFDDVINSLRVPKLLSEFKEDEFPLLSRQIIHYVKSRIQVNIDGENIYQPEFLYWQYKDKDSNLVRVDTIPYTARTFVLTYSWPKKPTSKFLNLNIQLFPELVEKAIGNARVHWKNKVIVNEYLLTDDALKLHILPDSLDALHHRVTQAESSGGRKNVASTSGLLTIGMHQATTWKYLALALSLALLLLRFTLIPYVLLLLGLQIGGWSLASQWAFKNSTYIELGFWVCILLFVLGYFISAKQNNRNPLQWRVLVLLPASFFLGASLYSFTSVGFGTLRIMETFPFFGGIAVGLFLVAGILSLGWSWLLQNSNLSTKLNLWTHSTLAILSILMGALALFP